MSLKKVASFLGAFKIIWPAFLLIGCASQKPLTVNDRMKFLDHEIESSFTVRKILPPSSKKTHRLKEGQWVRLSTHYKNKNLVPHFSTIRVLKLKKDRVTFEVETHLAGNENVHKFEYQLRGFAHQADLGIDRKSFEQLKKKLNIEKIKMQSGTEKPIEIIPQKNQAMDEHLFKLIFGGMRTSKMVAESCETEFVQSKKCWAYDYEIDRIKFRSKGRAWVHGEIPILGVVKAEDETSLVRVIQFGENRK